MAGEGEGFLALREDLRSKGLVSALRWITVGMASVFSASMGSVIEEWEIKDISK